MTRRMIWPLLFGVVGCAILIGLGIWQVQRLEWRQGIIASMEARLADDPVPLPDPADPDAHLYLAVEATGTILNEEIVIVASQRFAGPGYRVISPFVTDGGRRVLVDRGFIPDEDRAAPRPAEEVTVMGNLHWPQEVDSFTPDPDMDDRLWFARDVPSMAEELGTEEVLIVVRETSQADPAVAPVPLDTATITNNHRDYAITWFLLAVVWAGMTAYLLWRIRRQTA